MLLTQVGFNQASTKFYIMELILKYCMYWPDTLQKALKDTHGNLNCYVFLSSVVCSSQCLVMFCFMMSLFISAARNYPENVLKPQVLLLHKIHVWHIDGGHITRENSSFWCI